MSEPRPQDQELARLARFKQGRAEPSLLIGPQIVDFFKNSVSKRQSRFEKLAEVWLRLIPPLLGDHCALDSFLRGTLTVLVDSASHLYDLKQLLLAGLEKQLLLASRSSGLRKVVLRPGRWYEGQDGERKPRFD